MRLYSAIHQPHHFKTEHRTADAGQGPYLVYHCWSRQARYLSAQATNSVALLFAVNNMVNLPALSIAPCCEHGIQTTDPLCWCHADNQKKQCMLHSMKLNDLYAISVAVACKGTCVSLVLAGVSMARRCHDNLGWHILSFPGASHHCILCRSESLELEHHHRHDCRYAYICILHLL